MQTAVSDTARDIAATLPKVEKLDSGEVPADVVWGDWDDDKKITATDAAYILQYVLAPRNMSYTQEQVERCRVYGDDAITASDSAMVLQKALDEKVVFPVEKK